MPSAVSEIETIPQSIRVRKKMCVRSHKNVCGINVCVSGWKGRGRDVEEKSATVDHHIIKKKSDSANSVSVRIQITNKCRTLLNRPLAIIAGPTRYFQNLWRLPVYLAINPHHVTNRFVTGNDLLSQGYMKWSWPLLDRQELNWPTHPSQLPPPTLSLLSRPIKTPEVQTTPLTASLVLASLV